MLNIKNVSHNDLTLVFHYLPLQYDLETYHGQVDVGGVQLQVDLPVDGSLAVLVEILSHLRAHVAAHTRDRLHKRTHYTVKHFISSWCKCSVRLTNKLCFWNNDLILWRLQNNRYIFCSRHLTQSCLERLVPSCKHSFCTLRCDITCKVML